MSNVVHDRNAKNYMTEANNTGALIVLRSIQKLVPGVELSSLPTFSSKSKGLIVLRCPDLIEKPGAEFLAKLAQQIESLTMADEPISSLPSDHTELTDPASVALSWSEPHCLTTGSLASLQPAILRMGYQAAKRVLKFEYRLEAADANTTPKAVSKVNGKREPACNPAGTAAGSERSKSCLVKHSEEVTDAILVELDRGSLEISSLICGLTESQQRLLRRNCLVAAQTVLERFQNQTYSAGLHSAVSGNR